MNVTTKIGFGKEVSGEAVIFGNKEVISRELSMDLEGKMLIFLTSPSKEILEKARFVGALGVVVPSMHYRDFEYFKNMGDFVIVVLQRFGVEPVSAEIKEKIIKFEGKKIIVNGDAHEIKTV